MLILIATWDFPRVSRTEIEGGRRGGAELSWQVTMQINTILGSLC